MTSVATTYSQHNNKRRGPTPRRLFCSFVCPSYCSWQGFVVPVEPHVAVFLAHVAGPGRHFAMTQLVPGFVDALAQGDAFHFRDKVIKARVGFKLERDIDPVVIHRQ